GSALHPIRLRTTGGVGDGWRLRILSVTPNADSLVKDYGTNAVKTVPPKAQDVMLTISAKYTGGGEAFVQDFMTGLNVIGKHHAKYPLTSGLNGCGPGEGKLPAPDLGSVTDDQVFSGRTLTGHICFQIAANDAASLRLYYE